ncbi:MAG TPA: 2-phosphosulfolactate phosphatase [Pirellulaceae bacterium]|nr:2-phosphosulfolactate phosphatase [Pirellulaceae bacterium]
MNARSFSELTMPAERQLDVYLLPALVEPAELAGKTAVVIDVLRATTTVIHALACGATQVLPCLEVEETLETAAACLLRGESAIRGGERGGRQIPGFELGNSPAEYSRQVVGGKTVVFTTTNGTRAMLRCRQARRVLIGAFVNFSAVCRELGGESRIALVCAGTDGHVTREDTLLAGAIASDLAREGSWRLNDQAEIAADSWQTAVRLMTDRPLGILLRGSRGGRNLIDIGQENDIDLAAQIDKFDIVPELDLLAWRIR